MPAESSRAVFLSYASQDAEAARRVCDSLRAAGVEVWFDQSELRGGDAWDAKIRKQIKECALFVPVISGNTQARLEGYFRIEWKLAAQRTHAMAEEKAFLLPIVIDDTSEADAKVPAEFREVQWTRLRHAGYAGLAPDDAGVVSFCERAKALLSERPVAAPAGAKSIPAKVGAEAAPLRRRRRPAPIAIALMAVAAIASSLWFNRSSPATRDHGQVARATPTPAAKPPLDFATAKSIAVLPFADLSPNKDSEYFSDGLAEEILNALARDPALRVAARTSSFSFKGRNVPVDEIGRVLRAAHIIEGSVRRDGNKVRITVQLINATDGYHLWSQPFDGEMTDIFALQGEIARKVAEKLGVRPMADAQGPAAAAPPTTNLAAYDAYLRARELHQRPARSGPDLSQAVRQYEAVVRLDPGFALAWAHLANAAVASTGGYDGSDETMAKARQAAETALRLAPNLPEAHTSQAYVYLAAQEHELTTRELDAAEKLRPNDAEAALLRAWADFVAVRWTPQFWSRAQRAVEIDPQSTRTLWFMGAAAAISGHFAEAEDWLGRPAARQSTAPFFFRAMNRVAWRADIATALAQLQECPESFRAEIYFRSVARLHEIARDSEAALHAWERALIATQTQDRTSGVRQGQVSALLQLGLHCARRGDDVRAKARFEEAVVEAEKLVSDYPRYTLGFLTLASVRAQRGEKKLAEEALARGGAARIPAAAQYYFSYAEVLAQLGRIEDAVSELRILHETGLGFGHLLRLEPKWDPLRADPKFQQLMREAEARANAVKPVQR